MMGSTIFVEGRERKITSLPFEDIQRGRKQVEAVFQLFGGIRIDVECVDGILFGNCFANTSSHVAQTDKTNLLHKQSLSFI